MGSAEALEDSLLDVGNRIVAPPPRVDELLQLLDEAETLLSRVEQSPSQSMLAALDPAMAGLTVKELLGHSDADVKVAVASCISEITRITAPEAPYDDDLMKDVFEMIVEAFRKLDDTSSRSYLKRVSILETVAKVRSCVVMLDLECDSLILEMFHHFLNTIRDNHPENVLSSMEMIMTLVLEESEDISTELLSCLLMSVKRNNKDVLPIARKLAEKVIGNCALKLQPSLTKAVQSMDASLGDFSKIVASVCQGSFDVLEQNGVNVSGKCLAGESKISESVLSDEMPQVSQRVESEVACPEVTTAADKLPTSVVNNGTAQTENDLAEKLDSMLDHGTKKARRQKSASAVQPKANTDHLQLEAGELRKNRKSRGRENNTSQTGASSEKEAEAARVEVNEKRTGHHASSEKPTHSSASVISVADNEKLPDSSRPKRGRSSGFKYSMKKVRTSPAGDVPVSLSGSKKHRVNGRIEDEAEPLVAIVTKKQTEGISGSEKKPLRHSRKKGHLENLDHVGKSSTNSHSDMATDVMADQEGKRHGRPGRKPQTKKASKGESSGKHRAPKTKKQKSSLSSENNVAGDPSQKGMVSSSKMTLTTKANKDPSVLEESPKAKSGKKRAREEISEASHNATKYDETLVGVRIRVWWPDDDEFYPGVIDSYNPATMRHKVLYSDGDEEDLLLKDETIQLLKDEKQEEKDSSTLEPAEMQRKKAKRSDSSVKSKVVSSSKSGGSAGKVSVAGTKSGRKRGVDLGESTGGQRGGSSKTDDGTLSRSISKGRKGRKFNVDMPKSNIPSEDELNTKSKDGSPRATSKIRDSITKPGRKSKSDTPRTGRGSKDNASKIGSARNQSSTRSKAKDDVAGTSNKPKLRIASPGKSRSKSGVNGSVKVKNGSTKRPETEDVKTEVISNARKSEESEVGSRKKRRKKSQS